MTVSQTRILSDLFTILYKTSYRILRTTVVYLFNKAGPGMFKY